MLRFFAPGFGCRRLLEYFGFFGCISEIVEIQHNLPFVKSAQRQLEPECAQLIGADLPLVSPLIRPFLPYFSSLFSLYSQIPSWREWESSTSTLIVRHLVVSRFPRPGQCFVKVDDQKIDRFLVWKNLLEVDHVTPKTKVCSLHFLKSDYFFPDIQAQKRILKKIAVPSCNLPGGDVSRGNKAINTGSKSVINENPGVSKKPNEEILFVNVKVENADFESTPEFANFQSTDIKQEILDEPFFKDAEVQVNESPKPSVKDAEVRAKLVSSQFPYEEFIRKSKKSAGPEPPVKDAEVQVNTGCILFNVIHCIKSDQELHISTGIESFDALSAIVQRIKEICGEKFEHPNMRLNTRERVIMTFMKLKHNLSYSFLAILFKHYTPTHCKRVITETMDILSQCSKDGISWPLIKDIKKTLQKHS